MKKVIVVIPTLNEEKIIAKTIIKVFNQQKKIKKYQLSILVVDGNSTDSTRKKVKLLKKQYKHLFLMNIKKRGLGLALAQGMKKAVKKYQADLILTMDADGSHNPNQLSAFIDNIKNTDIVIGSRYTDGGRIKNWNLIRRILSLTGNLYLRITIGLTGISDFTSNFRLMRKKTLKALWNDKVFLVEDWTFLPKFLLTLKTKGYILKEIPIVFSQREAGYSKMNPVIYSKKLFLLALNYKFKQLSNNFTSLSYGIKSAKATPRE